MEKLCKNCRHWKGIAPDPWGPSCRSPKVDYGYGNQQRPNEPDQVMIENDEGWGMLCGPEYGCVFFEPKSEEVVTEKPGENLEHYIWAAIEEYKQKPSCLNCEELNEHNVCYNPECSPVCLTKWRRKHGTTPVPQMPKEREPGQRDNR